MRWNEQKSIALSVVCVRVFMAALALVDLCGYWLVRWFLSFTRYWLGGGLREGLLLMTSLYLCSFPAWVLLWQLHRLLSNIGKGQVFVPQNVAALRRASWCCAAAAGICLASAFYYFPFGLVAVAAGFMTLIVRIVKNCFEQAVSMKNELDYTV